MFQDPLTGAVRPVARSLSDLAHTLESLIDAPERLRHALALLKEIVPYDVCALAEALPPGDCHVMALPELEAPVEDYLCKALLTRLGELREMPDLASATEPRPMAGPMPWRSHLAAPLVALDEVMGLLLVAKDEVEAYGEQELSLLSIVAAQIAGYVAAARLRERESGHVAALSFQAYLLNVVEQPVIATDFEGRITYWNRYAESLYGWSSDEVGGRELRQFILPESALEEGSEMLARVQRGEVVSREILNRSKSGRVFPVFTTLGPIRDADGRVSGIVASAIDISDRKRAEEQLERLRNEFLGMVSHELRTPLTAIKGAAALGASAERLNPVDAKNLFRVVNEQADRLHELVADLMDVSRIEEGALSVNAEPAPLPAIIQEATDLFTRWGGTHRLALHLPPDLPQVKADRPRMVQVISNLLGNAAKFSPPASAITIEAQTTGPEVVVRVRDEGVGIAREKLSEIFKPFTRLHEQGADGTGLGLTICRGIVEAHKGRIWADSEGEGRGSTFSFTLPAVVRKEAEAPRPSFIRSQDKPLIVAVDDEAQVLRYLERALDEAGYRVITSGEAREAPSLIEIERPDLVLLDLTMPGMSGFDVLQRIRELSQVPVIFLTGNTRQEDMVRALRMGADDYITKPFLPSELLARIEAVLRRRTTPAVAEESSVFELDDLVVNFAQRRVVVGGKDVSLSATEYKLLHELAASAGRVLTHDQLLQRVWGPEYSGETELVRSFIRNLRQKLGDPAAKPRYIVTERQVGYYMRSPDR